MEEPLIQVKHLGKSFGSLQVLKDVTVDIYKGDVVCVIGASGSGKSTFLRCLNLLEEPTEGQILFEGTDITDKRTDINKHRQKMGMVFQQFNLFPHMTILENLTLAPIKLQGKKKEEIEPEAMKLLERVGLADRANAYPSQLSGGQQQRVSVGRALITHPAVILADEPTGNLDQKNTKEIMDLFCKLNRTYKQTIVMITHDMRLAAQCDRVLAIVDGRLAAGRTLMNQKVPLDN